MRASSADGGGAVKRAHLGEPLTLADLAAVAAFSSFHFHRVFRAATGETLFGFVHRVRLERAATALVRRRHDSVLAIALDHGFASAATFARAFRARFGMSATAWRAGGADRRRRRYLADRKPGQQVRKGGKAAGRRRADTAHMPSTRLGIAHDDPSITPPARCRYDACVVVPRDFAPDRTVAATGARGRFRCELHLPVRPA